MIYHLARAAARLELVDELLVLDVPAQLGAQPAQLRGVRLLRAPQRLLVRARVRVRVRVRVRIRVRVRARVSVRVRVRVRVRVSVRVRVRVRVWVRARATPS